MGPPSCARPASAQAPHPLCLNSSFLEAFAADAASCVLRLDDRFASPNFAARAQDILAAIFERAPLVAAPYDPPPPRFDPLGFYFARTFRLTTRSTCACEPLR